MVTLEGLKKSATASLARKYEEAFSEAPSAEMSRGDMIQRLWQHFQEAEETVTPEWREDAHYDEGDEESAELGERYHRIFSAGEIRHIRDLRIGGMSYKKIADQYDVSHTFIRNVCIRRLYKDVK